MLCMGYQTLYALLFLLCEIDELSDSVFSQ